MSYARFSDTSGVYVFHSTDGLYECCSCWFATQDGGSNCYSPTAEGMIEHLRAHVAAGHKVRQDTFDGLAAEAEAERLLEPA
jgi:hypothetical protein